MPEAVSYREFEKMPPLEVGKHVSVTGLRRFDACPRSFYLYRSTGGGPASHPMARGSALHRICELATKTLIQEGEAIIPPDVVKAIATEVLADPAYHVPISEHDAIREMAYRWASQTALDPARIIAVETLFALQVGEWQVRAKLDFAELSEDGSVATIRDLKTARAVPGYEEIGRRRKDGTIANKDFQGTLYVLALLFGRPVRVEVCPTCRGTGDAAPDVDHGCLTCADNPYVGKGTGKIETVEPFGLAERAQRVDVSLVFPAVEGQDGLMIERTASLTKPEAYEYLDSLRGILDRLAAAEESRDWPAIPGSHCAECAAPALCPIPRELRDFEGLESYESMVAEAEYLDRIAAETKKRKAALRSAAKAAGTVIRFGSDQVLEFAYQPSKSVRKIKGRSDWDGLEQAVQRAVELGEPFDLRDWISEGGSTAFRQRTLTAEELESE
jgi:hypothetical protein